MDNNIYLVALHFLGYSHKKLHEVFKFSQDYKGEYEKCMGLIIKDEKKSKKYERFSLEYIDAILKARNVTTIKITDSNYPGLLKELVNPPYIIYVRGVIPTSSALAIIGSRKVSQYGKSVIEKFVPHLCQYFSIVSGGAYGCDSIAHTETLKNGGKTIAVIGTGINIDYPSTNRRLYDEIVKNGGSIISIFPINEGPNQYNFPIRNEIISALSLGVLVVEAGEKSGTLITANLALDQGKDVFAVPGDIFKPTSYGCNALISSGGAKITLDVNDILEEFNIHPSKVKNEIVFTDILQKNIYELLLSGSNSIDTISKALGEPIHTLGMSLSLMELNGIVKKIEGGEYKIL